jgi:glycosyltransferase involved in cell wall biosynthesis
VDPASVVVVENGTEVVNLLARENLKSFQHTDDHENIMILYVGGFEPWHGLDVLLKGFQKLISNGISAKLLLIGSGVEQVKLETMVREYSISDFVTFAGYRKTEEMAALLAHADIGVSPYCGRVEYSGLKLLDYKAAGLPSVVSGKDGQPSVIDDGQTGLIVPPCDVDALYEALYVLSTDSERRKAMGRKAREEAERFHTWNQTALGLTEIFIQVKKDQPKYPSDQSSLQPAKVNKHAK